jgi:ADP-heptose:LPS heptosyltransferase
LLANLDLLISTDTGTVHAAGAINRPVWTLLHVGSDWRWLRDREDTPWYPSMRLLRQKSARNWREVLERTATRLQQFATTRRYV